MIHLKYYFGGRQSQVDEKIARLYTLDGALPPPPPYSDCVLARMTAFPCMLDQRTQVRLDGYFCAVHAVADMLRSVCLTYLRLRYAGIITVVDAMHIIPRLDDEKPEGAENEAVEQAAC